MDSQQHSLSSIADFFTYLFTEKNLKPMTFSGYRTAITDHLGYTGVEISQSFELNRLIASFHRDRPMKDRSIPSSGLSLVLLSLTKPPFEPLKNGWKEVTVTPSISLTGKEPVSLRLTWYSACDHSWS